MIWECEYEEQIKIQKLETTEVKDLIELYGLFPNRPSPTEFSLSTQTSPNWFEGNFWLGPKFLRKDSMMGQARV